MLDRLLHSSLIFAAIVTYPAFETYIDVGYSNKVSKEKTEYTPQKPLNIQGKLDPKLIETAT